MQVHGYTATGSISATIDGETWDIPDDMSSRFRQMIAEWEDEGNTIPVYSPPSLTPSDVDRERDRRIDAGFDFDGVRYQSRPEDRENIAGAVKAATDAIALGALPGNLGWQRLLDPAAPEIFRWIAADNTTHPMDAETIMRFGYAALVHKQAHIFAARAIKDSSPIPADYATNPAYWP